MTLWKEKICVFPFTKEDFKEWCDNIADEVIAYVLLSNNGKITGGFIAYPVFMPPSLFVQLMVTLHPKDRVAFREPLAAIARAYGFDNITCACPSSIGVGMAKLFNMKEIGKVYKWTL